MLGIAVTLPLYGYISVYGAFSARELRRKLEAQTVPEVPDVGEILGPALLGLGGSLLSYLIFAVVSARQYPGGGRGGTTGSAQVVPALKGAARRLFPLIGWGVLAGMLTLVAFLACGLPAFYVAAATAVLAAVVTFGRGGVIARCFRLFHGDLGSSVARIATMAAIAIAVGAFLGSPISCCSRRRPRRTECWS